MDEMIHTICRENYMDIAEITRDQFDLLEPELQRCIQCNGEYGHTIQGKTRCQRGKPRTECLFYSKDGCGAYDNIVRVVDKEDLVVQSVDLPETSFSSEESIPLD